MKNKVSKIGFIRANPNATYQEFKAATGGTKNSFYTNRWVAAHYNPNGTWKKKTKPSEEKPNADKMRIAELEAEVASLNHQIVGFRAVVSYLENLADIRSSQ